MAVDVAAPWLVGFLLSGVRTAAWLLVAPPFASRAVPAPVKALLAAALALAVTPQVVTAMPAVSVPLLLASTVLQVAIGAALGFVTYLVFAAVQAAGDLVDLFGGFQLAAAYDPLSLSSNSVFGRLHQLLAVVLLFAVDGHLVVVRGFLRSFQALPLDTGLSLASLAKVLTGGIGEFFVAALQIAAPLVGVLFLADAGLGLLTRVAPSLNAFALGFPAKILLTLLLVGLTFPLLPTAVRGLVDLIVRATSALQPG
ncbi:MAG: flagellar biosynthetic protein FliR [Actinomycetota bacterium]